LAPARNGCVLPDVPFCLLVPGSGTPALASGKQPGKAVLARWSWSVLLLLIKEDLPLQRKQDMI